MDEDVDDDSVLVEGKGRGGCRGLILGVDPVNCLLLERFLGKKRGEPGSQ